MLGKEFQDYEYPEGEVLRGVGMDYMAVVKDGLCFWEENLMTGKSLPYWYFKTKKL